MLSEHQDAHQMYLDQQEIIVGFGRLGVILSVQGVQSLTGNYKDNRFNGSFETSAEVFVHRNNFIYLR